MKQKKQPQVSSESTDSIAFLSLPMKWRDVCYRFALSKNIPHNIIIKSKFKIDGYTKLVKEIVLPNH